MLKKSMATAIGLAALLIGNGALAAAPAHPADTEAGIVYHGPQYAKIDGRWIREDTWNTRSEGPSAPSSDDGWEFVGGEAGWQLRQHGYDFKNGRLVHSDNLPHNTPRPGIGSQDWATRHIGSGS